MPRPPRSSASAFDDLSSAVHVRVVEALLKLSLGMRKFSWDRATAVGLTPTQGEIVRSLHRAERGLRMREVSDSLGVSAPTATDAVSALENKGLVTRASELGDRRVTRVELTARGRALGVELDEWFGVVANAVASLPESDEQELLRMLMQVLRQLHSSGGMPTLKMCVTCRHFSPNSSGDSSNPHRCELVGSDFGDRHLRVDCAEHELAPSEANADKWVRLRRK